MRSHNVFSALIMVRRFHKHKLLLEEDFLRIEFPLEQVRTAHEWIEAKMGFGKIVLVPTELLTPNCFIYPCGDCKE